ncbi:uracil-DNA glycosylase [Xylanibacillus composti]|nr:uracil-DNA glycosylase [Xylanibacillus composti]MDT9725793.1 uracil-DNA glycosylase [Xylanibacillus composti]
MNPQAGRKRDKRPILRNDWAPLLEMEFEKDYYLRLREFLKLEYRSQVIYPEPKHIFNALHHTPYANVKVVILGQDPYHGPGQAHGLSFSVRPGVEAPPSLRNIFKELQDDIGCSIPRHGHLKAWAAQGVLLLNTVLTVRAGEANSHRGKGWEMFTDAVMDQLNAHPEPIVFLLWGRPAQEKAQRITAARHLLLRAPHPSPLSAHRGFFGSKHFSKANAFLKVHGRGELDWRLPDDDSQEP